MKTFYFILFLTLSNLIISQNNVSYTSSDELITALYGTISGKAGERDWDTFKHLFYKDAYMASIQKDIKGATSITKITPDEYIQRNSTILKRFDFFEKELHRNTLVYGSMKTVYSSYEFELHLENKIHKQKGINAIQLLFENNRWWIMSLIWVEETPDNPLPSIYLSN